MFENSSEVIGPKLVIGTKSPGSHDIKESIDFIEGFPVNEDGRIYKSLEGKESFGFADKLKNNQNEC